MGPGETIETGADMVCDCGHLMVNQVLRSPAGFYIGTQCDTCGPWSRESGYYKARDAAQAALNSDAFGRR